MFVDLSVGDFGSAQVNFQLRKTYESYLTKSHSPLQFMLETAFTIANLQEACIGCGLFEANLPEGKVTVNCKLCIQQKMIIIEFYRRVSLTGFSRLLSNLLSTKYKEALYFLLAVMS